MFDIYNPSGRQANRPSGSFISDAKNIKPTEYGKEKPCNKCGAKTYSQKIGRRPFPFDFFCILPAVLYAPFGAFGEMAEWSKAHAWKVCIPRETVSWVRIPLSPPRY